jgi:hypothetical protein
VSIVSIGLLTSNPMSWQILAILALILGFGFVIAYFRRLYWVGTAFMLFQLGVGLLLVMLNGFSAESTNTEYAATMTFSVFCDFLIILLTRRVLRNYARKSTPSSLDFIGLLLTSFLVPLITVVIPMIIPNVILLRKLSIVELPDLSTQMDYRRFRFFMDLQILGFSNVYSNVGLLFLLLLVVSLIFHLITWEAIQGPLYAAQRFGIASKHKTLALIGGAFVAAAFMGEVPDLNKLMGYF